MNAIGLRVRTYGDPCLRKKSKPVKDIGASERFLINAMIETMHAQKGIGLAAPQVGVNEQILVADVGDGPMALVNPRILSKSGSDMMEEGCLSIPDVLIKVKRAQFIVVEFLDVNNRRLQRKFSGLIAKVIQHETDHLNGKLIIDYATSEEEVKFQKILRRLEQLHKDRHE